MRGAWKACGDRSGFCSMRIAPNTERSIRRAAGELDAFAAPGLLGSGAARRLRRRWLARTALLCMYVLCRVCTSHVIPYRQQRSTT